ncbi:restriction endonuclease subunit S [Blastococcus sp. SYSU DS0669]
MLALGECCEIVSGATPKSSIPDFWGGDVAWATPADLSELSGAYIETTPRKLTAAGLASCSAKVLPVGSVLLSSRAPIGHVAINRAPMATNQGFKSLIPKAEVLDAKYLYHWLCFKKTYLQSLGNGATFKEISKTTVARVEIPVPSMEEQRRIAAILDQVDDLRAKRRQQLAHLDALPQSLFHSMFAQSYEPSPLGHVATFIRGVTFKPDDKVEEGPGAVAVMRTKNVQKRLDRSDEIHIPARLVKRQEQYLSQGDTLISSANSWNLVGKACFVESLPKPAAIGGFVTALRSRGQLDPHYLFHWFTSRKIQEVARSFSTQTTNIANLNLKRCADLPIPVPPIDLQREFAACVAQIHAEQVAVQHGQTSIDELSSSLLSRAFRGGL